MFKHLLIFILGLLLGVQSFAQVIPGGGAVAAGPNSEITGNLQTATGGNIAYGTLTFTLSQPAVVSGTSSVAASTVACYTSASGSIVGVPDPLVAPVVSTSVASGTLAAGTYYVRFAYVTASGSSAASPETAIVLSSQGGLNIGAPAIQPASATGFYAVYIGTSPNTETLQAIATGWTTVQQSTPLSNGSAFPTSNSSSCNLYFSDQLVPTGTFYTVGLVNQNGSQIAGFPQTWCTYGGAGATINVSNGAPTGNCGTNGIFYPTPLYANPQNNALQSINGSLNVTQNLTVFGMITSSALTLNGPLAGTITGNPIFSGNPSFSGNPTFIGHITFPNSITAPNIPYATPKDFGAKGDTVALLCSINNTSTLLSCPTATFTTADVGKAAVVTGAGSAGVALVTTIAAFASSSSVNLVLAASTTVSSAEAWYGTDDTVAIRNAVNAGVVLGGTTCLNDGSMFMISNTASAISISGPNFKPGGSIRCNGTIVFAPIQPLTGGTNDRLFYVTSSEVSNPAQIAAGAIALDV